MELSPAVSEKIAELLKNSGLLSSDRYIKITTQCSQDKGKIVNELLKKNSLQKMILSKLFLEISQLKNLIYQSKMLNPRQLNLFQPLL